MTMDLVISPGLTRIFRYLVIRGIGICVWYVVFVFLIRKFHLPIPGVDGSLEDDPLEPSASEPTPTGKLIFLRPLTVDAWPEGSYQKALQALVLNRTVADTDTAKKVLDDLIEANKEY